MTHGLIGTGLNQHRGNEMHNSHEEQLKLELTINRFMTDSLQEEDMEDYGLNQPIRGETGYLADIDDAEEEL